MQWIPDLELALPELAGKIDADAPPHEQLAPLALWIQTQIKHDDLIAATRAFDWVAAQIQSPSELQRSLLVYVVSMLHFSGLPQKRRHDYFKAMPPKLFVVWRQLNQSIDAAHELE